MVTVDGLLNGRNFSILVRCMDSPLLHYGCRSFTNSFFSITTMAIAIPTGVKILTGYLRFIKEKLFYNSNVVCIGTSFLYSYLVELQGLCLRCQQLTTNTITLFLSRPLPLRNHPWYCIRYVCWFNVLLAKNVRFYAK